MKNLQIETDLKYDYDDNYEFVENFKHIKGDTYLYIDCGNFSSDFYINDFFSIKDTKKNNTIMRYILVHEEQLFNYSDVKNESNIYLYELIQNYIFGNCDYNLDDIEYFLNNNNLEYKKNYYNLIIKGNSQGDVNQILINKKEFIENFNSDFNYIEWTEHFTNVFYNPKIIGDINISFDISYISIFEDIKINVIQNIDFNFDYYEYCDDDYNLNLDIKYIVRMIQNKTKPKLKYSDIKKLYIAFNKLDYTDVEC